MKVVEFLVLEVGLIIFIGEIVDVLFFLIIGYFGDLVNLLFFLKRIGR